MYFICNCIFLNTGKDYSLLHQAPIVTLFVMDHVNLPIATLFEVDNQIVPRKLFIQPSLNFNLT